MYNGLKVSKHIISVLMILGSTSIKVCNKTAEKFKIYAKDAIIEFRDELKAAQA